MIHKKTKLSIAFVAFFRGIGGAQKQTVLVANAMAEKGHTVTLIPLGDYQQCFDVDKRIKVINVSDGKNKKTRIINRFKGLKKALLQAKPDVTISFWLQPIYLAVFMNKKITGKLIYSERCDPSDKQYSGFLGMMRAYALKKVDGFVFQTTAAKNYFNKTIQNKSIIIPNPLIDTGKRIAVNPNNNHKIVSVGRLHKQKNFSLLIDAFNIAKDDIPDYNLYIYGDGEEKENLEQKILEHNLKNRVVLAGTSKNVKKDINGSALFVLPSDYEGMPNALLEALSLGIPCISTNWAPGGVVDIIDNYRNGLIIDRNDKKQLAEKMLEIINDKELSKKLSKNGKISTAKYEPEKIFSQWDTFIERVGKGYAAR